MTTMFLLKPVDRAENEAQLTPWTPATDGRAWRNAETQGVSINTVWLVSMRRASCRAKRVWR